MEVALAIERKLFSLKWSGIPYRSLISITEKGTKKSFRSFLTRDGSNWLANRLCQAVTETPDAAVGSNTNNRWRDHQATLRTELLSNSGGRFLQTEIMPASKNGRMVRLCFPEGKESTGWKKLAEFLTDFSNIPATIPRNNSSKEGRTENKKSYAQAAGGFSNDAGFTNGETSSPAVKEQIPSVVMKVTTKIETFSVSILHDKLKQMELWVEACKRMGGHWKSSWEDDFAKLEVTLFCCQAATSDNVNCVEVEDADVARSGPNIHHEQPAVQMGKEYSRAPSNGPVNSNSNSNVKKALSAKNLNVGARAEPHMYQRLRVLGLRAAHKPGHNCMRAVHVITQIIATVT